MKTVGILEIKEGEKKNSKEIRGSNKKKWPHRILELWMKGQNETRRNEMKDMNKE